MDDRINTLYVFPDTNVLVQCKALSELDWNSLGSFDRIVLILARPVISEIDKQKSGHGRLAKRAREANSLLRKLLDEEFVEISSKKKGVLVILQSGDALRASPDIEDQLDYSTADDKLVGTIYKYKLDNPEHSILFLSHDTGPLMTAKRHNVPYRRVPDEWLLTPETNDEQKQINALQEQLRLSTGPMPDCKVEFVEAPWCFKLPRYLALTERQISTLVQKLANQFPPETEFDTEIPNRDHRLMGVGITSQLYVTVSSEQILDYKDAYQKWLDDVAKELSNLDKKMNAAVVPAIDIAFSNEGTGHAHNVEIKIEVMGEKFCVVVPSEYVEKNIEDLLNNPLTLPTLPEVPKGYWRHPLRFGRHAPNSRYDILSKELDSLRIPFKTDTHEFFWKNGQPTEPAQQVVRECVEWRHHDDKEIIKLRLIRYKSVDFLNGSLKVTIRAANIAKPITAYQPVKFEYEDVDILPKVKALLGVR